MCLVLDREEKACISDQSEMQLDVLLLVVAFLLVALALQVVALRPGGRPSAI